MPLTTVIVVPLFGLAGFAQPVANSTTNELTAEEKAAGWILLFDGKTWHNWRLSKVRKCSWWKIERGWIRSIARSNSSESRRLEDMDTGGADLLPSTSEALQVGTALGFEYQLTVDENGPDALDSPLNRHIDRVIILPRPASPIREICAVFYCSILIYARDLVILQEVTCHLV